MIMVALIDQIVVLCVVAAAVSVNACSNYTKIVDNACAETCLNSTLGVCPLSIIVKAGGLKSGTDYSPIMIDIVQISRATSFADVEWNSTIFSHSVACPRSSLKSFIFVAFGPTNVCLLLTTHLRTSYCSPSSFLY